MVRLIWRLPAFVLLLASLAALVVCGLAALACMLAVAFFNKAAGLDQQPTIGERR